MKLSSLLVSISLLVFAGVPAFAPVTSTSICVPKHADDDSCMTDSEWQQHEAHNLNIIQELDVYRSEVKRLCYGVVDSTIYPMLASEPGQVNETTLRLEYEPSGSYFLDQEVQNRCTLQ